MINVDVIKKDFEKYSKNWHLASDDDLKDYSLEELMAIVNTTAPYDPDVNEVICVVENIIVPISKTPQNFDSGLFIVKSQNEYIPHLLKEVDSLKNQLNRCSTNCNLLENEKKDLEQELKDIKEEIKDLKIQNEHLKKQKETKKNKFTE